MDNLAEEANAGVRLELVPLMKVPGMTGARARALHAAGITRPDLLAVVSRHDRNGVPTYEPPSAGDGWIFGTSMHLSGLARWSWVNDSHPSQAKEEDIKQIILVQPSAAKSKGSKAVNNDMLRWGFLPQR